MNMKKRLAIAAATCIICSILVVQFGSAQSDTTSPTPVSDSQNEIDINDNPTPDKGSRPRSKGFYDMILNPFKHTLERAKNYFNNMHATIEPFQHEAFSLFMNMYNKSYPTREIPRRMELFFLRRNMIEESVKAFNAGKSLFAMRENPFIDWDDDELKRLTGVSLPSKRELAREQIEANISPSVSSSFRYKRSMEKGETESENVIEVDDEANMIVRQQGSRIPASKDWRETGCVSRPINQMKCGACYAIATMSALETIRCLNQVSAPILSPQQVVDCSTPRTGYANYGCDGGWPTRVLKYLRQVGVAARETCYPFVRRQGFCRMEKVSSVKGCTVAASPTNSGLQYKVLNNERDILYHVANTGPVITVMKATNKFLYYGRGIFDDLSCSRKRDDVDHAIVIVGYGRENGVDYWLIKNSWGVNDWGEGGYGKYRRGTHACSIGHWGWVITS